MLRLATVTLLCCAALHPQGRGVRISREELAILDESKPRRDFPCTVRPTRPALGFDLRMHTGIQATFLPGYPLEKEGNLRAVLRVTPASGESTFTAERTRVPKLEELRDKRLTATSGFAVGEGRYRVDWLLRDQAGGVCSTHLEVEAKLPRRARGVSLIAPGLVQSESLDPFRREPRTAAPRQGLHLKVLVNFASRSVSTAVLEPRNLDPVLSILRALSSDNRVASLSVVGFLLVDQRVFYRQGEALGIDFPALGTALKSLELGTVEYERFVGEKGQQWFLADLLKAEVGGEDRPDALVIVGPQVWTREDIPAGDLKRLGPVGYPVFYMKCGPLRIPEPFDTMARLIGVFRGRVYRITSPAEIGNATRDAVDRILRSRASSVPERVSDPVVE